MSGATKFAKSSLGRGLKKAAITSGKKGAMNVLSDALTGKKVKDSVASEVNNAKKEIAKVLRKSKTNPHPKTTTKRKKLNQGLLD